MSVHRVAGALLRAGWSLAAAAAFASPSAAAAFDSGGSARILYVESLRLLDERDDAARKPDASGARQIRFDAYGRRFELSLTPNGTLTQYPSSKPGNSALALYRGRLDGTPGSWVRLAMRGSKVSGMVWDGAQLYLIEPAIEVSAALAAPIPQGASQTLIFRLADVIVDAGAAACASGASSFERADHAFKSLLRELKSEPLIMQAAGASRRLSVSVLGDRAFQQRYADALQARDAMLTRLNNVDGIFSAQLGIEIQIADVFTADGFVHSLPDTTSADKLLQELAKLRKRTPELRRAGLTHLFTGRELDGTTIGLAYVGSLCHAEHGVGLTETRNTWLDSLVAAHEIGHNFGADHDGDPHGSCAGTSSAGYLMSATVSGIGNFSACSLDRLRTAAQSASCITSLPPANVAIPAELGLVQHAVDAPFAWQLRVANAGGLTANNVRAQIELTPALMVEDANIVGGSCLSGAGVVECQLGSIAGGTTRDVTLTLRSDVVGSNRIAVQIASDNDVSAADNRSEGTIRIEPQADLAVTIQAPANARANETFSAQFTVTDLSAGGAAAIQVLIELPQSASITHATLANGTCSIQNSTVRCTLASLDAGATAQGSLSLSAAAGSTTLHARVSGDYIDPNAPNDTADATVNVGAAVSSAAAQESTPSPTRGGGGSIGIVLLLALSALRRYRPARPAA